MTNDVKIFIGVITATFVLIAGAVFLVGRTDRTSSNATGKTLASQVVSPDILERPDSWKIGSESAKVTVTEFGDYQCPACKATEATTQALRTKYEGKIRFVWRHFPLTQLHEFAFDSALAVEAAGKQGKFWDYHQKLFEISPDLQKDKLENLAKDLGLDLDRFNKDKNSDETRQRILTDQADGNKAGVSGTPTYYINGVKLELDRLPTLSDFSAKIDPLLK
ncbi:MAG: DsbA-like protein thioredoxin domain-containing protein [Microgenomates group bacterium GW2011_GWA1_48_10]|nr:MAG: DsbA-like protein thioredoxin domain-containing protein [Microgenomates group bacterium GW2011_GWA1_48_10]